MTLFVFLPASAGTRIIPADARFLAADGLNLLLHVLRLHRRVAVGGDLAEALVNAEQREEAERAIAGVADHLPVTREALEQAAMPAVALPPQLPFRSRARTSLRAEVAAPKGLGALPAQPAP